MSNIKNKAKKIYMTDKMLREIELEWYKRGVRQTKKEIAEQIADVLGLTNIFQRIEENY